MASPALALATSPPASLSGLVWRGDRLASTTAGQPTGHPALDQALPGGGWPHSALAELLVPHGRAGELGLLLPLLRSTPPQRWSVCIAPPCIPYAPALQVAGLSLERLLFVQATSTAHARWAARQALESRSCSVVVMWLAEADHGALRRLQLAAEECTTLLILIRPDSVAQHPSPAVLRLGLSPRQGGLDVRILKRRGPQLAGPISIDLPWPLALPQTAPDQTSTPLPLRDTVHALVRTPSARSAPSSLHARAC